VLVAAEDLQILFPNHADQQAAPVAGHREKRSSPHQRIAATTQVRRGAANAISAWCVAQARADGVELDVPRGGQQIGFIERERSGAPLPEMPAPALAEVASPRVPAMRLADGPAQTIADWGTAITWT